MLFGDSGGEGLRAFGSGLKAWALGLLSARHLSSLVGRHAWQKWIPAGVEGAGPELSGWGFLSSLMLCRYSMQLIRAEQNARVHACGQS